MSLNNEINNQYDFFKNVKLDENGALLVSGVGSSASGNIRLISNRNTNISADGARGTLDTNGLSGWNFKNTFAGEKINWYYVYNQNPSTEMTLGTLNSMYALVTIYNERAFFFSVYTERENDGNDYSWYRSRVNYELPSGTFAGLAGETVLVYFGADPDVLPEVQRVELPYSSTFSNGPQGIDEKILFAAIGTDSSAVVDAYDFTVHNLGYSNNGNVINLLTKILKDFNTLDSEISVLKSFKEAVELGRFFRGYVADEDGMNALPTPVRFQYTARMDTATIFEYDGTVWNDTQIVASLEGIAQEEELVLSYSDTKYIDLDGINDYVNVTGLPEDVMEYKKEWSLSVKLEGAVSPINDSSYITLFKRGTNEVTLRRGGTNWGIYVYNGTSAVCQANTWYAPTANSKILIVSTTTHLKYYLDGVLRANMAYNANTAGQDFSGDLELGNSTSRANWFGGVNNLMVMVGPSANLGKDQLAEFNAQDNVSNMSFYPSVVDFITLGERPYPSVLGLKQVLEGTIENSTESAIIVKDPAGDIGIPFAQRPGTYVQLDGTDNFVEFDNANADVMDFSPGKQWSLSMKANGVTGIVDYAYATLWKRGKNEITLRRGGTNWGLYVFCNGQAIGQANTWYAPQEDSTLVFTFDGTKIRYYIDGALRSTLTVNGNISHNDASGNLMFGQPFKSAYVNWYGGISDMSIATNYVLSSSEINEFGNVPATSLSYYSNLDDYMVVGTDVYPDINGLKGVITGNLINGTPEDFVNI